MEDGSTLGPWTHVRIPGKVPGSWLQPGSSMCPVGKLNQQMEDHLFFFFSLLFISIYICLYVNASEDYKEHGISLILNCAFLCLYSVVLAWRALRSEWSMQVHEALCPISQETQSEAVPVSGAAWLPREPVCSH